MTKLSHEQMAKIQGGDLKDVADVACYTIAAGDIVYSGLALASIFTLGPIGAGVLIGANVACLAYGVGRKASWW